MSDSLTRSQDNAIMQHFGKHVVGLACKITRPNTPLEPGKEHEEFHFFSGGVFAVKGSWWIVTAGHVFEELEEGVRGGHVVVHQQFFIDYFGVAAEGQKPIPCDFMAMRKVWKYDRGLDFAVIPVPNYYRTLLEKNHIKPLDENAFAPPSDVMHYQYRIFGCPKHFTSQSRLTRDDPLVGHVKPTFPVVKREVDDTSCDYPMFKGVISEGLESVVGLSGGPILGLAEYKGQHIYNVMALQSKWLKSTREIWGCPCHVFIPMAEELLRESEG
jgi:hypothetical protein